MNEANAMNLLVRLRPKRLAVIVPTTAGSPTLTAALELLSIIWGGDYFNLLPYGDERINDYTRQALEYSRPEIIITFDLDDSGFREQVWKLCQPMQIENLKSSSWRNSIPLRMIEPASCRCAIDQLQHDNPNLNESRGVVWRVDPGSPYAFIAHAAAGYVDPESIDWLSTESAAKVVDINKDCSFVDFVASCSDLAGHWTWLDLAGYGLTGTGGSFGTEPQIVVIDDKVSDIAYYWNLRVLGGRGAPSLVLPVPVAELSNKDSVCSIADWIIAANTNRSQRATYTTLSSLTVDREILGRLARALRPKVIKAGIKYVDVQRRNPTCPIVIPSRLETTTSAEIDERTAVFLQPGLHLEHEPKNWMCDILKDAATGHPPFDFVPPTTELAAELCCAAVPPTIPSDRHVMVTNDGVSVECSKRNHIVRFEYPTNADMLEQLLQQSGFSPTVDDKRLFNELIVERFGGLWFAADCCSAIFGNILDVLLGSDWTEVGQVKAVVRNTALSPSRFRGSDIFYRNYGPDRKKLSEKRFRRYFKDCPSYADSVEELLAKWEQLQIIDSGWTVGKCSDCGRKVTATSLNSEFLKSCERCSGVILPVNKAKRVVRLTTPVAQALGQGASSVIMTARYFKSLSSHGFIHLLGAAGQFKGRDADIDFIACCEGKTILAECKTFTNGMSNPKSCNDVIVQLEQAIEIGHACGASVVALACLCNAVPAAVQDVIRRENKTGFGVVLLTKSILEEPFRQEGRTYNYLQDLIPSPPKRLKKLVGERKISFGSFTQTTVS